MSGPTIVSRELIAKQAAHAAQLWVQAGPGAPRTPNPYCQHFEPEHHLAWQASFERSAHLLQCPEAESCS